MERLRTLSEAECYERCYGWRYDEDTVKVLPRGCAARASARTSARSCGCCSSCASTHASPKRPDRVGRPGRPRARAASRLLRDQPGSGERSRTGAVREPAERLLAPAPRGRLHASSARAAGVPELLESGSGLTNAARRTTRGSGDLRAADFAGARERLETIAAELRPRAIGFVGKAAYQGVFRERPEHGAAGARARARRALRPAVDVSRERRGPVGRAAPLVPCTS